MAREDVQCPACMAQDWESILLDETQPAIQCRGCGAVLRLSDLSHRGLGKAVVALPQKEWYDWELEGQED